jgi:hypothetical protein
VSALIRMRLRAFIRSGRALAPLMGALVVISLAYGGGAATPGEAYGFTAIVMFPVIAWQTKIILDGEPDVQRRLARVAVGSATREWLAGLIVALIAALGSTAVALLLPWIIGGIKAPDSGSLGAEVALGLWAHLLAIPPAIALGALASRVITGTAGRGAAALVAGAVFALVLGLRSSPVPWLAPPLLPTARLTASGSVSAIDVALLTAQAAIWAALAIIGYALLRRARA